MMDLRKASLLLYLLLFFLHLQHHFTPAISRSTKRLASVDPNHDNLPVQAVQSKPDGNAFAGKPRESAVVVLKGSVGGGGGRGGGSFGGGGRSFGGGGRGGSRGGSGEREKPYGGGGRGVIPFYAAGSHHGGRRSSGARESASSLLSLSTLIGLVLVF